MKHSYIHRGLCAVAAAGALAASNAWAQSASDAATLAQQRYQQALAACNDGSLPAPARDACVRSAGRQLDRVNGGPPVETPTATPDGRATVVAPVGAPPPPSDANTTTSRDGRATIVAPSDGTAAPRQ
jgi:hypothetical protein